MRLPQLRPDPTPCAWIVSLGWCRRGRAALVAAGVLAAAAAARAEDPVLASFRTEIEPLLDRHCYDCHGFGKASGGVILDEFESGKSVRDPTLWLRVLKNTRSGIMPPAEEPRLPEEVKAKLAHWIKQEAFQLDPHHPDPGRVTVRRLNRVEYRNTIRELMGVDFDTSREFPADDTGHGFDNIGDVLTISPLLLEKYLDAAQTIVTRAVPVQSRVVAENPVPGRQFVPAAEPAGAAPAVENAGTATAAAKPVNPPPRVSGQGLELSYYTPTAVAATHWVPHPGRYQLVVELRAIENYVDDRFDLNRCRLRFKADGETLLEREFVREGDKTFHFEFERDWAAGHHEFVVEIEPLGPERERVRNLRLRLNEVNVRGPLAPAHWVPPRGYAKFFPGQVPADARKRREYTRGLLADFAARAYRRPADAETVDRLVAMAEGISAQAGETFEAGVAQAMVAVLASPRFLFREEEVEKLDRGQVHPRVDEYALASRLSYFLWSSMPDAELFRLAAKGRLRAELTAQVGRMLKDPRSAEFITNFTGQWLQARDIETVQINPVDVFLRENPNPDFDRAREVFQRLTRIPENQRTPEQKAEFDRNRQIAREVFRAPKPDLNDSLRRAMRRETELTFDHVVRGDRSLLELIDSDYTFLNEELARHYGIEGVTGPELRKTMLAPGSPRGGVLTQGTVLAVTSNPTRTSPVKRGVFILEAILGTPPAPPPPNIPALEDVATKEKLAQLSLRETLALHAGNDLCRSCHSRMDPLGLALENFNALGRWRDQEMNQPIETAGQLITDERFTDIRELKRILATNHRYDFYHSVSEKLLTYALGRGVEYTDTDTLDDLVHRLEAAGGRPSALIAGIIESAPFQRRRQEPTSLAAAGSAPAPGPTAPLKE